MIPTIAHIYGPLYIQSYGVCISLALYITLWFSYRDPQRKKVLNDDQFIAIILWSIVAALLGGRLLYLITSWQTLETAGEIFKIWHGGFSLLGSLIGVLGIMAWYAKKHSLKMIPLLDFFAVYAPLMQSISRIGCFLSGCCHGKPTLSMCSIIYHHSESVAPCGISLHPTQLYSTITLFVIFLSMLYLKKRTTRPGILIVCYLLLVNLERFCIDFLRGDQEFFSSQVLQIFSVHQWLSLLIFWGSLGYFFLISYTKQYESI